MTTSFPKKLIEVALPLPEINDASAYDKMPGIGPHPKGIHHWWARLPLPTARAVLFASVVDDPEAHPEKWPTEELQNAERERLFDIIRRMMEKKLHEAPEIYAEARAEMVKHSDGRLPAVFDPFAGGGSIPLEGNRMGFEAHAGDLNPVAVLLNKCNLELAPRWVGHPPVNQEDRKRIGGSDAWQGTDGLAADVRNYGKLVRQRAIEEIGHLYPRVRLEHGGGEVPVVAWIWARTVASPNPVAKGKHVPLISTFWLSTKKGAEVWLQPVVETNSGTVSFEVKTGRLGNPAEIKRGTKRGRGARFQCILTDTPIDETYLKEEAKAGRLGVQLLAVVGEVGRRRGYFPASKGIIPISAEVHIEGIVEEPIADDPRNLWCVGYGLRHFNQLFTHRQLKAMATFSRLVSEISDDVFRDAKLSGMNDDRAKAYSTDIATFLALSVDRCADFNNSLCRWSPSNQKVMNLFGRQAIPMVWDFAEANIMGDSVGAWETCYEYAAQCVQTITGGSEFVGQARQIDAATGSNGIDKLLVSTDPPYYDNISYAGLSDFFYVWLRRTLGTKYPELFSTMLVPKGPELTASPERFGGDRQKAKEHFEAGFRRAFTSLRANMDHRFPLTVYYAFKQDDEESGGEADETEVSVDLTTGWETLLEALISSGFQITATWPVRASQAWRMRSMGSNALASYIVLACRPRPANAAQTASTQFRQELTRTLPTALRHLQQGNIAPVDFAQAAIGPGMAVYSRYSRIIDSNGKIMGVRAALAIVNQTLTEVLSELEDDFDADTRWAIAWFEQNGFAADDFGNAEILSKAKVTSVSGLQQAGIVTSKGGKVRLLRPDELASDWNPTVDHRSAVWGMTHHLLRIYHYEQAGDEATAALLRKLGSDGDVARELAYRLFNISEKKKLSQEAQGYNALVLGWPEIARIARQKPVAAVPTQGKLI